MMYIKNFALPALIILFLFFPDTGYSQGYICAVGGGSENYNDWSNAPYQWMVQKASNKKIIILSYSDATDWLPDYFISLGAVSAYNKKINSRAIADDQSTYDELITADGIFLKGGDQNQYITLWKGTKTEQAITEVFHRGGVIGGTSAGAMVLGQFNYTARYGSASSREGLTNPLSSIIDIDTTFLNLLPGVLFDTHFIERGRFGRLIAMLFKSELSFNKSMIGVGIDDRTAICIDSTGIGTVMGSGAVAIFQKDQKTSFINSPSGYSIENLRCDQLTAGWSFDFVKRQIHHIPGSAKDCDTSRPWQYPEASFFLTGSNSAASNLNSHIPAFLTGQGQPPVLVISHSSFQSSLTLVTSYLSGQNFTYDTLLLSASVLNDPAMVQKMESAGSIVFCGDSPSLFSLLRDTSAALGTSFYQKILEGKPLFFWGKSGKAAGEKFIDNTDSDIYASYRGRMTSNFGLSLFRDLIFQPQIFESSDYAENRASSVLWGLMVNRKRLGIYLDGSDRVVFNHLQKTISGSGSVPLIIVDARYTTKVDSSVYRAGSSIGPRQVVAMNNLRYSVTKNSGLVYSIQSGGFHPATSIAAETGTGMNFILRQNYPNPFNPSTTITYTIPAGDVGHQPVTLRIYDLLGTEIAALVNEPKPPGSYTARWNASGLPSGVYFYRLQRGSYSITKSMLLLK